MYVKVVNSGSWLNPKRHTLESMGGGILKNFPPTDGNLYYVGKCYKSPMGKIYATISDGSYEYHLLAEDVVFEKELLGEGGEVDHAKAVNKLLKIAKIGEQSVVLNIKNEIIFTGKVIRRSSNRYEILDEETGTSHKYPIEDVLSVQNFDPNLRKVNCTIKELMELIKADKPAEHILMDIEDYITN